jgi:8-oxo-dGTP pyrophosphatase MutT (NUDIX family)
MVPEGETGWQIVESHIVIDTPHLRLRRDEIELPSGKRIGSYYVRESRGFAVVFAVTPDERVVLVRQYKHGVARAVLELPAGGIDDGEDAEACARRELAEETGFVADAPALEHAGTFLHDPTGSTTRFHLFLARDVRRRVATTFDETEQIEVQLASYAELRAFVRDGTIDVGAHVASIYYMLDRLGRL